MYKYLIRINTKINTLSIYQLHHPTPTPIATSILIPIPQNYQLTINNTDAMAQIDIQPLLDYLESIHSLTIVPVSQSLTSNLQFTIQMNFQKITFPLKQYRIKIKTAEIVKNNNDRIDPYIKIRSHESKWRWQSQPIINTYQLLLNEIISIKLDSFQDNLQFQIVDDNLMEDDIIGSNRKSIYKLMGQKGRVKQLLMYKKEIQTGKIWIELLEDVIKINQND